MLEIVPDDQCHRLGSGVLFKIFFFDDTFSSEEEEEEEEFSKSRKVFQKVLGLTP